MPKPLLALSDLQHASEAELIAAHNAGMSLVAWRAAGRPYSPGAIKSPAGYKIADPVHSPSNRIGIGEQKPDSNHLAQPISIVLPWSTLLTDNNRQAWVGTRMMTTKEYKAAKAKAVDAIETQVGNTLPGCLLASGWQPLFCDPVSIRVVLIEPNRTTKRDLLNYQKLICDAMKGVVYTDDSLIDDAHFTRGTPDIDRPRAEITVTPIGAQP